MVDEFFQIGLETVHVRAQGHNPVVSESLLYEFHFIARHMGEAEDDTFPFHKQKSTPPGLLALSGRCSHIVLLRLFLVEFLIGGVV